MNAKKIPYYFLLFSSTVGASLILGFLSFGGMFALWPILPLALTALGLSVAYEGEIYFQNSRGALNKLFKRDYLKHYLANEFLLNNFPNTEEEDCPQFFKDYQTQLRLLHKFNHKTLDKVSEERKRSLQKTLTDMEKWFAEQLFSGQGYALESRHTTPPMNSEIEPHKLYLYRLDNQLEYAVLNPQGKIKRIRLIDELGEHHAAILELMNSPEKQLSDAQQKALFDLALKQGHAEMTSYQAELQHWLANNKQKEAIELLRARTKLYKGVKAFSLLAGFFMGLGTTYLLVGEFAAIPILATIPFSILPAIILPMSIIAGAAYALLIFNAVTDMINNDTLRKWYRKLRDDFKKGITVRNVLMTLTAVVLITLAVALTICTAGTWWTVAKNARPLFNWMLKIPSFVMGLINPIITGLSALIFNIQNTSETFELIDETFQGNVFQRIYDRAVKGFNQLRERENWLQVFNPFRLLLKITIAPLRALLFIGHLISIGVTADRVPGIPVVASALLGIISEGFEDLHYFVDHEHEHSHDIKGLLKERLGAKHSHDHSGDLPTKLLIHLFAPIYFLASVWDFYASKKNEGTERSVLESFDSAWKKQHGEKLPVSVELKKNAAKPSDDWKVEHALYRIERHKVKQLNDAYINPELATTKAKKLTTLQTKLRSKSTCVNPIEFIDTDAQDEIYNQHRFFNNGSKTRTQQFLEELPKHIGFGAPAA